jgi:hypothetical protein
MKRFTLFLLTALIATVMMSNSGCDIQANPTNTTAKDEQAHTEINQRRLLENQPPPNITWSLERDNLIKRFKLQNDRSVVFYMYVLLEGYGPVGYYQVNKVSSVNSQLTNTEQLVKGDGGQYTMDFILPSPAEDGSYGTNGDGVFGFTPEDIYIEHNMKYIASTVPLTFKEPVQRLTVINVETEKQLKTLMDKINNTPAPEPPAAPSQP